MQTQSKTQGISKKNKYNTLADYAVRKIIFKTYLQAQLGRHRVPSVCQLHSFPNNWACQSLFPQQVCMLTQIEYRLAVCALLSSLRRGFRHCCWIATRNLRVVDRMSRHIWCAETHPAMLLLVLRLEMWNIQVHLRRT